MSRHDMHPLDALSGMRKYIFSIGEKKFFLHVVANRDEMERCKEASILLSATVYESQIELAKILSSGQRLKIPPLPPSAEEIDSGFDNLLRKFDSKGSGQTIFIIENEAGEIANVMLVTINDFSLRSALRVDDGVGTFVYVDTTITAEGYKGLGIFSSAFDKIITMLANPKRALAAPFEYCISMRATAALSEDGSESYHMMNFPAYAKMWEARFENSQLQKRWCYGGGPGIALEKVSVVEALKDVDLMVKSEIARAADCSIKSCVSTPPSKKPTPQTSQKTFG